MKSDEVGTTLKHPETIIVDVKSLSKSDILLIFHFLSFHFKKLKLPFNITDFNVTSTKLVNLKKNMCLASMYATWELLD